MFKQTIKLILTKTNNARTRSINVGNTLYKSAVAETKENKDNYYKQMNENQDKDLKPAGWDEAKPLEHMPGPKAIPFFGNMFRFMPLIGEFHGLDLLDLHKRFFQDFGNICLLKIIHGKTIVILYDPNDFELLFRNEGVWPFRPQLDSINYYRNVYKKDIFKSGGGVLTVNGEDWFNFRSTVNPIMMQPRTVQQYIPVINGVAEDFITVLRDFTNTQPNGIMPDDFLNELHKWSLESIGTIALETRLGCLNRNLSSTSESQILINSVLEMFDLMFKLDVLPSLWRIVTTPDLRKFIKTMDRITEITIKYIDNAIEKFEKENIIKPDNEMSALQRLIKKDREIAIVMAMDMLIAGIDTTSKTLAAALYYLSKNNDVQTKLREEIKLILPSKNSKITKEALAEATYLKATIKETQRLAPIGVGNARTAVKDMVIGGYQIPKGTDLVCSNLILSTRNEHFMKAKNFIPERWLRNTSDDSLSHKNAHPFVSLPFGFGPRSCVGKRMALLELEVMLAKIIRNFEINWPHEEDAKFKTSLLYGIVNPVNIQLKEIPC